MRRSWASLMNRMDSGENSLRKRPKFHLTATGTSPDSVSAADFNGDGKLDLVSADQNSNAVSVLLGNGHGTFQARTSFATGMGPYSAGAADFNGDGKLDLVTADF